MVTSLRDFSGAVLALAFFIPRLGLLSFFAMKHGPCICVLPLPGTQCRLFIRTLWVSGDGGDGGGGARPQLVSACCVATAGSDAIAVRVVDPSHCGAYDLDPEPVHGYLIRPKSHKIQSSIFAQSTLTRTTSFLPPHTAIEAHFYRWRAQAKRPPHSRTFARLGIPC